MDDYDYDEDEDDDEDDECDEMNTVSFDSMFELNSERKLGCDVDVCVSPSTITVRRRASNSHDIVDDDEVLFETRIRFLSFMGISNDVRLIKKTLFSDSFLSLGSLALKRPKRSNVQIYSQQNINNKQIIKMFSFINISILKF